MLARPSLALDFFSNIRQAGDRFAFLAGLVNTSLPTFECDWLDFKIGDDPAIKDKKRLYEEQKKVWSKALSAMANSGGGVLVWGVKAEKDKATRVDAANALALVPDVHPFVSRLQELNRQATDPPVLNVDYLPVPKSDSDQSGFVACLIPDSPFKPHRAEYVEGKPFFVRAGDNSAPASVALLRALFYPATNSLINIEAGVSWRVDDRQQPDLSGTDYSGAWCHPEHRHFDCQGRSAHPQGVSTRHEAEACGRLVLVTPPGGTSPGLRPCPAPWHHRPGIHVRPPGQVPRHEGRRYQPLASGGGHQADLRGLRCRPGTSAWNHRLQQGRHHLPV